MLLVALLRHFPFPGSAVDASDGKIVFPSDDNFRRGMLQPQSCPGRTFCESVANYPTNLVDRVIKNNSSLQYITTKDVINLDYLISFLKIKK